MKREMIAAIVLVCLVIFISAFMLLHWKTLQETTVLKGAVPVGKDD